MESPLLGDAAGWRVGLRWRAWVLAACVALVLGYVGAALTPSHYGQTAAALGVVDSGPILGASHPVRSDEWLVTTPYFQIAVASNFGSRDVVSPYHEPLKAFFALPSRDWSMAFKPDLWGFLVLDAAHAYSLHYAMLAAAFVGGFALFLRQLGCRWPMAGAGAVLLFLSQFVQVWWTSNAPVLAWAPWPFVAFLWRGPWPARTVAVFAAVSVWLIGQLYPPFILAAGLAMALLVLAFRPDAFGLRRVALAAAAAAAGVAVAWIHYADLIPVMAATAYPGHRMVGGGGVPWLQLAAHIFPYLASLRFEPLGLWPSNACEIGVVGSFLPLAVACFCDHRRLAAWVKARRWAVAVWLGGLVLLLAWMVLPVPGRFAPGFNQVPPHRMLWGFGLLWLLGVVIVADGGQWVLSRRRVAVFVGLAIAAWGLSKFALAPGGPLTRFDITIVVALLGLLLLRRAWPWLGPRRLVLAALAVTAASTFGRFNPLQPAGPIFEPRRSPALDTFAAYADANPRGWVVVPGIYGAAINGARIPAINHTLLQPQAAVFQRVYSDLGAAALNEMFNRYEHLQPEVAWAPRLIQGDLVSITPDPFAIPLPVRLEAPPAGDTVRGGAIEQASVTPLGTERLGVVAAGWAPWRGVDARQSLRAVLDPSCGRIVQATAYRLPRPDVVATLHDPEAFAAGFGLRLVVETKRPEAFRPSALRLLATDAGAVGTSVTGEGGRC